MRLGVCVCARGGIRREREREREQISSPAAVWKTDPAARADQLAARPIAKTDNRADYIDNCYRCVAAITAVYRRELPPPPPPPPRCPCVPSIRYIRYDSLDARTYKR